MPLPSVRRALAVGAAATVIAALGAAPQVVRVHSAPWTVSSWGKSYTYTDLSDHYPLAAH
ncbi:hypothetical protein AB0D10_36600 [Kitasatospora sp. NPDC048545]|uniref:hypothetical protein n=1 Tax=Kitasatospora sp. NPDC048545 TaxID=3157208 RepID=UPI0033E05A74